MDLVAEYAYVELGDFEYQANPWNKGELVYGLDFSQRIGLTPDGEAIRVDWKWPDDTTDIMSYPGFIWGMKPWSTTSTTPFMPARIRDITTLDVDFDLDWKDEPRGNFNVSFDIWIADAPDEASATSLSEVMVWVKDWDWEHSDAPAGTFVDANGSALVFHRANHGDGNDTWNYAAVVYDEEVKAGRLDVLHLLDRLSELGIIDRNHLLMDIELGAEIVNASAWLDINQLTMRFNGRATPLVDTQNRDRLSGE